MNIKDVIIRNKIYTGVGSRETPLHIQNELTSMAKKLSAMQFTLRSGHADGADLAFEKGSRKSEIYIPWHGFNDSMDDVVEFNDNLELLASMEYKNYRPNASWNNMRDSVRKLYMRNVYQVIGEDIDNPKPSDFLICHADEDDEGNPVGGTGFTVHIAKKYNVPIFNINNPDDISQIKYLMTYLKYDYFLSIAMQIYLFYYDIFGVPEEDMEIIDALITIPYVELYWEKERSVYELSNYLDKPMMTLLKHIFNKYAHRISKLDKDDARTIKDYRKES